MSTYFIGDIHGCYEELKIILAKVKFNAALDTLWLTGDLVARGPDSLKVLRFVRSLGDSVRMVLGNHDLQLLAVYAGVSHNKLQDHITSLLEAPDSDVLMHWLRHQPILQVDEERKLVMVHAGITPYWDLSTARQCAQEVEMVLKSNNYALFLNAMYGDMPNNWSSGLTGLSRLRLISNIFTRIRYCFPNGQLEMHYKDTPEKTPVNLKPWFALGGPISDLYSIVFGHWSSLMGQGTPKHIYGLDTGCYWGGQLTLLRWEDKTFTRVPSEL
ncbi:bis(5'-nucleosyl)-tetraphosphatase (symmetrical) ApaH [Candidatus Steffania adelgidicola]|uniref:bis(5'-nucleosyl)-tetraphosphatase (symmetrical) ApaH n=1 Tax=Candidatus Steffania adelgidicola TaxID=1076626 RepID=UPI001D019F78|nr:bis(5'-nucleosyl)-tetraphosphatase (symmetrical) ApaH [Candidatus Steffania adelgidicola]UDG80215.1 Bis(5'-nucleosyl)-tetraphosphatase, symmetrical [Candidatus Steffania adelgidicola]